MDRRVVLSLGSNKGDSIAILREAVRDLSSVLAGIRVSSLYVTKPRDYADQEDFRNIAVSGSCGGSPRELLASIHRIEASHGRDRAREIPKGPRSLDIDIILFGDLVVREPDLAIPHERANARQFVLVPLLELHPDSADPLTGESFADVLAKLPDQGVEKAGDLYGN